jgi:serine protease
MTRRPLPLLAAMIAALALCAPAAEAHARGKAQPIAHATAFIPDDPGRTGTAGGWQTVQWNFVGPFGVDAPDAWQNLINVGRPGGKGVVVAVLDTGVAYSTRDGARMSPDLRGTKFVAGYDFVHHDPYANDVNGHGTHVASTIAETTGNGLGLTGLAYGVSIMPVQVLDDHGDGDAPRIAEGIRWAAAHGAQVINLSLEFDTAVTAKEVPELISALDYARSKGALVVGASGNESYPEVSYPARASTVLSVGATTEHGCLSAYSNTGKGLDVVAPGGGDDAPLDDDGDCHPDQVSGHDIYQVTLEGNKRRRFGIPSDYEGTSMAAPHVSAIAALIIASGVLGAKPTPQAIQQRIEATSRDLGAPGYDTRYGWGLVDAAAATAPGIAVRPPAPITTPTPTPAPTPTPTTTTPSKTTPTATTGPSGK